MLEAYQVPIVVHIYFQSGASVVLILFGQLSVDSALHLNFYSYTSFASSVDTNVTHSHRQISAAIILSSTLSYNLCRPGLQIFSILNDISHSFLLHHCS